MYMNFATYSLPRSPKVRNEWSNSSCISSWTGQGQLCLYL